MPTKNPLTMALAFAALCVTGAVSAEDAAWTGWLGPHRDGWVSGFEPPAKWPAELERVWQVEVGTGYGSPLIIGESVYQHARQGEEEVVWRLDLGSGDAVWRKSYHAPFQIGGGGEKHGKGPKSTPALADGRLLTLSITGVLTAWDAESGEVLWQRDESTRFGKGHPYWGASTSPLVDGDRVIVHFGNDERGELVAMDVRTGDTVWTHGRDGASYASPILVEIDGVRQVVELNMRAIVSVDSQTGEFLWEHDYPQVTTDQNMVTPVFHDGLILQGGENRGIHCLQPRRDGGEWSVQPVWHQREVALDMSTAVINDGLLYGMSHYGFGRMFCLDPATGDVLWQGPRRLGENVMFLAVPGHVVALISDGRLQIVNADSSEFVSPATYQVADNPTWAPPVLLSDGVLIKDSDTLTRWSFAEESPNASEPDASE